MVHIHSNHRVLYKLVMAKQRYRDLTIVLLMKHAQPVTKASYYKFM